MLTDLSHFLRKARKRVTNSFDPEMQSAWLSRAEAMKRPNELKIITETLRKDAGLNVEINPTFSPPNGNCKKFSLPIGDEKNEGISFKNLKRLIGLK